TGKSNRNHSILARSDSVSEEFLPLVSTIYMACNGLVPGLLRVYRPRISGDASPHRETSGERQSDDHAHPGDRVPATVVRSGFRGSELCGRTAAYADVGRGALRVDREPESQGAEGRPTEGDLAA